MTENVDPSHARQIFENEGKGELVQGAKQVLLKILTEGADPRQMDDMLAEIGITSQTDIEYLETPHKDLGGLSPFSLLRSEIVSEQERQERLRVEKVQDSNLGLGEETTFQEELPAKKPEKSIQIADPAMIETLGPETTHIHLTDQSVVKTSVFETLLDLERFPNLRDISISPSLYDNNLNKSIKRLIEDAKQSGREIDVRPVKQRMREYDFLPIDQDFLDKERLYLEALEDPQKRAQIDLLVKYELDHPEIARLYFTASRREKDGKYMRMSARDIGKTLGLSTKKVSDKLSAFLGLLGREYADKTVMHGIRSLKKRINNLQQAERNMEDWQELRESFETEGVLPPEGLPVQRWEEWSELYRLVANDDPRIAKLQNERPRDFAILLSCFITRDKGRGYFEYAEIAKRFGFSSYTGVTASKNRSLERLGIASEE
jgi:hypothetical protein